MKKGIVLLLGLIGWACCVKAQQFKWIVGNGQRDTLGNWSPFITNNLKFYEIDFSGSSPVSSIRPIGNSIKSIQTYGTGDPGNCYYDKNGNLEFYLFCAARTAANGSFWAAPGDTFYIAEYNQTTHADEVTAKFATTKYGVSVVDVELVSKDCSNNEFYIFYKMIAATGLLDEIRYVVYNHTTKTLSAPVSIVTNRLTGEGMAISRPIPGTNNRYFFFTTVDTITDILEVNECLLTPAGVSAPRVVHTFSYPNVFGTIPCYAEISDDQTHIAFSIFNPNGYSGDVLLYDLNINTGALTNQRVIDDVSCTTGSLEFSPDGQKLFIFELSSGGCPQHLYYIPLPSGNINLTSAPFFAIGPSLSYGGFHMQKAYDGNIYFNRGFGNQNYIQIANPNAATPTLNFLPNHFFGSGQWVGVDLPDQVDGEFIYPQKNFKIGKDSTFCGGSISYQLHSIDTNTVWSTGAVDSSITVTAVGTYSAYLVNGCDTLTDTVHIYQFSAVNINLGNDTTLCPPFSLTLSTGNATTVWSTGLTASQINVNTTGTYWASISNSCGSKRDTIHVFSYSNPSPFINKDTSVCRGQSVQLNSSILSSSYLWSTGAITPSISVTPLVTTAYWLQITTSNCTFKDSVIITVLNPPANFSLGNDTSFCNGTSVKLSTGIKNTVWSNSIVDSVITFNAAGKYWATITNQCGSASDTIVLTVLNPPTPIFIGNDTLCCQNFSKIISTGNVNTVWSTGITAAQITVSNFGTYWADLANKCGSVSDTIKFGKIDLPKFSLGNDTIICSSNLIQIGIDSTLFKNTKYLWQDNSKNSFVNVKDTGTYILTVTNECGSSNDSLKVSYEISCKLNLPNTFTPNKDGQNDIFFPKVSCVSFSDYLFIVYNRWGEKMFESNDVTIGWDGIYHKEEQPVGTYVYYMYYTDNCQGKQKFVKGNFMLLR